MIIKKWNGSTFDEIYPKTTIADIYLANGTTAAFAGGKIAESLLPNTVFDSLKFYNTIAANGSTGTIALAIEGAINQAETDERSAVGFYFVVSTSGTINQQTTSTQTTLGDNQYYQWTFKNNDAGQTSVTSSGVLEVGDWIVITLASGTGTSGDPYIVELAVVNNTYEVATSTSPGIVALGSDTTQTVSPESPSSATSRTYPIQYQQGTNKLVVNVPWVSGAAGTATTANLGLVKLGAPKNTGVAGTWSTPTYASALTHPVYTDNNDKMIITLPEADASTYGLAKIGYTENSQNYAVKLSSGQMYVTVPWTDTNTTYTAGSGITLSGTQFSHTDTSSVSNSSNSGGVVLQSATFDTYGHVQTVSTIDLDNRYYTQTSVDGAFTSFGNSHKEFFVQASAPTPNETDAIWFDI